MSYNLTRKAKDMTILRKIALTIIILFLFMLMLLYIVLCHGMQIMLDDRAEYNIKRQAELAKEILRTSSEYLQNVTANWATWDNTYKFATGDFDRFLEYDLNDYPYQIYDLDFITVLDLEGNIIYERFYTQEQNAGLASSLNLHETYKKIGPLTAETSQTGISGFLKVNDITVYMSSCPILRNDRIDPCAGSLIFGRIINDEGLNYLGDDTGITFSIQSKQSVALSDQQAEILAKDGMLVGAINSYKVETYRQFDDIFGEPSLLLTASSYRDMHQEGAKYITVILALIAVCCIGVLLAVIKFIGMIIVKPFATLVDEVNGRDLESLNLLPPTEQKNKEFTILIETINNMSSRIRSDKNAIAKISKELYYRANYDLLTGLRNLENCSNVLSNEILTSQNNSSYIGTYFIGLDRFNIVNNTLGNMTGDRFIISIAQRIEERLGQEAVVGRVGDEKFIIIMGGFSEKHEVHLYADKIISIFETPFSVNNSEIYLSPSVGSCIYPDDAKEVEVVIKNAEIAMYHAKHLGGNLYCRYEMELKKVLQQKLYIENELRSAVNNGCEEFRAYFQPKTRTETGEISSCEALIRWVTPRGIISPEEFIPLAEESGLIVPLSKWMLTEACWCNKMFEAHGIDNIVSVNISSQVLLHHDFIDMVKDAALETGMDFSKLDIEITEATLINDVIKVNKVLDALHELGITISIDDFGIGYSSLSYLKKLSIDRIKIDRSFIVGFMENEEDKTIVNAIVAMAKSLHVLITAEGVENAEQYHYLKNINCEEVQGYFISKPVSYHDYIYFYKNWRLE